MSIGRIASLFAELGFRVDYRRLNDFERRLRDTHRRLNQVGERAQKSINRTTKAQTRGLTTVDRQLRSHQNELWKLRNAYFRTNQDYKRGTIDAQHRNRVLRETLTLYRQQQVRVRDLNREVIRSPLHRANTLLNTPARDVITRPRVVGTDSGITSPTRRPAGGAAAGGAGGALVAGRFGGPAMIGAGTVAGIGYGTKKLNDAYQNYQRLETSLTAIEGSIEGAHQRFLTLYKLADDLGQRVMPLVEGWTTLTFSLMGTPLEHLVDETFEAISKNATAFGEGEAYIQNLMGIFASIARKGKLDGDTLERLNTAKFSGQYIADAMGISIDEFNKRLSEGEILAEDLIPKLNEIMLERANLGGALDDAIKSTRAEAARAANQATLSNIYANQEGIDYYFNEFYQALQEFLQNATPLVEQIAKGFEAMAEPTREYINSLGEVFGAFGNLLASLDGLDIESPLPSLTSVLQSVSDWINDVADFIEVIRSDTSWQQKLNGLGDLFVNKLTDVIEGFFNFVVDKVNAILPSKWEIDPIQFERRDITARLPQVDLSGVNALLGDVNTELTRYNKELQEKINKPIKIEPIKVPLLNEFGGLDDPFQLPFGPVMNREGDAYNSSTINQDNTITINIDGAKQPDEILGTIEDHISNMMRNAASSDTILEK